MPIDMGFDIEDQPKQASKPLQASLSGNPLVDFFNAVGGGAVRGAQQSVADIGTTLGNIDLEGYESLPICYESEFKYTFFPSCNVSSYKEKLPNSRHYGSLDKVDGKITYEIRYDEGNVTYSKTLLLNCSPIKENLVK